MLPAVTRAQELHEMFIDMAILIESQGPRACLVYPCDVAAGEMIDRIEMSVSSAQDYVTVGGAAVHALD